MAERVALVKKYAKEYGLNFCCRVIGIAKNTVYKWRDKTSTLKTKYAHLKPVVQQICEETCKYGKRRLAAELKRRGYKIGVKLAGKLNRLWGNVSKKKLKFPKASAISHLISDLGIKANLLRLLKISEVKPFEVIMGDATEIEYNHGKSKATLTSRECLIGKFITGYSLSTTPTSNAALGALQSEAKLRKKLKLTFEDVISHQDQGSAYTSYEYTEWLLSREALLSYSKKGTPGDNAVKEAQFGRFKDEFADVFLECETYEELQREVENAIKYYNEKRLHSSLGYVPPKEYLESLGYKL